LTCKPQGEPCKLLTLVMQTITFIYGQLKTTAAIKIKSLKDMKRGQSWAQSRFTYKDLL
jgi:hypothetical protein